MEAQGCDGETERAGPADGVRDRLGPRRAPDWLQAAPNLEALEPESPGRTALDARAILWPPPRAPGCCQRRYHFYTTPTN